ncbi:MAG: deoxyribose-phosphate aldolase [Clostridia bacterium]|nr:deoxyribose-phosphate aldolase [Clostridia bacterium]
MNINEILNKCDHTLLLQTATEKEIIALCDDAIKYNTASVCIPPCYVALAKGYLNGKIPVCTVIGFPNGNMTAASKAFETRDAVNNGADEIDMVINIGALKDKNYDYVLGDIVAVRNECKGKILKVIIETCLLTDDEKVKMCEIVSESGADYIKTSTGFSKSGATFEDVKIFADNVKNGLKIKAAGGIASLDDAQKFIELGAERLGTSRIVKIAKEMEQ